MRLNHAIQVSSDSQSGFRDKRLPCRLKPCWKPAYSVWPHGGSQGAITWPQACPFPLRPYLAFLFVPLVPSPNRDGATSPQRHPVVTHSTRGWRDFSPTPPCHSLDPPLHLVDPPTPHPKPQSRPHAVTKIKMLCRTRYAPTRTKMFPRLLWELQML